MPEAAQIKRAHCLPSQPRTYSNTASKFEQMTLRLRKLIGAILLVAFILIYSLIAMEIGAARFAEASTPVQAIYFLIAGLLWVPVAALLIRWMQRPDR